MTGFVDTGSRKENASKQKSSLREPSLAIQLRKGGRRSNRNSVA
jgi:hypothetical protein